jgi:hypothetical protein
LKAIRLFYEDSQHTSRGERLVQKELRRTLLKYKLHTDGELFDKAYGYIRQYYYTAHGDNLRFSCFVGAASSRDKTGLAAGSRSYKNAIRDRCKYNNIPAGLNNRSAKTGCMGIRPVAPGVIQTTAPPKSC